MITIRLIKSRAVAAGLPGFVKKWLPAGQRERLYSIPFVSGRALRESYELQAKVDQIAGGEKKESAEFLDDMGRFICLVFGNQFTLDELYGGYGSDDLILTGMQILGAIRQMTTSTLGALPRPPAGE